MSNVAVIKSIAEFNTHLQTVENRKLVLVTDTNVAKWCLPLLSSELDISCTIILPAGEKNKNISNVEKIWSELLSHGIGNGDTLICLGGGVITDIGGFAAATYKRGIRYINIPTSLIGMVDAAHGGKTAINFDSIKNSIGQFYLPHLTLLYLPFLKTLPAIEIQNGFGEIIKYGILIGQPLFEELKHLELNTVKNNLALIQQCYNYKNELVKSDFTDQNQRKLLNLGHTIGHALEATFTNLNLSHGYFVAQGIALESIIAYHKGILSENNLHEIIDLIVAFFGKLTIDNLNNIWQKCLHDKKNSHSVNACLPHSIGNVKIDEAITFEEFEKAVHFYETN